MTDDELENAAYENNGIYIDAMMSKKMAITLDRYNQEVVDWRNKYQTALEALQDILTCERINRGKLERLINELPDSSELNEFEYKYEDGFCCLGADNSYIQKIEANYKAMMQRRAA